MSIGMVSISMGTDGLILTLRAGGVYPQNDENKTRMLVVVVGDGEGQEVPKRDP